MAASYSDQQFLAADPMFQLRVRQSLLAACIAIKTENPTTTPFHREREAFCVAVMLAPDNYKILASNAVATNSTVISDATVVGTVVLTQSTAAAQAVLVTDAHIDAAISGQFNSYFRTPGI